MECKISIPKLREIINALLDHTEKELMTSVLDVPSSHQLYWHVDRRELRDMKQVPTDLDIGSLRDDWDLIATLPLDKESLTARSFLQMEPLLRYLGEELPAFVGHKKE